jgi:hypothetical protein
MSTKLEHHCFFYPLKLLMLCSYFMNDASCKITRGKLFAEVQVIYDGHLNTASEQRELVSDHLDLHPS